MKYMYPAIFEKEQEDLYLVEVPDLPGCRTFGKTPAEAIEMVSDAVSLWLTTAEDDGDVIPEASKLENYKAKNGFVNYIVADTETYRALIDNRSVKKTLTIPNWLNKKAELMGINFSQILQEALKKILKVEESYLKDL